ncbi:hypothetical protein BC834DRAFT_108429 [Gloeopeniophorella convolvens]|nr:hypothetical protein BC834DRAFT_108429 [Gloeopeniophorella convolvens]
MRPEASRRRFALGAWQLSIPAASRPCQRSSSVTYKVTLAFLHRACPAQECPLPEVPEKALGVCYVSQSTCRSGKPHPKEGARDGAKDRDCQRTTPPSLFLGTTTMSRLQQNRAQVASRTAFDLLSVDSGDESEEEEVVEQEQQEQTPVAYVEPPSHLPLVPHSAPPATHHPSRPSRLSKRLQKLRVKKRSSRNARRVSPEVTRLTTRSRRRLYLSHPLQSPRLGCLLPRRPIP